MIQNNKNDSSIQYKIIKLQARLISFVMAIIGGLSIFLATVWLLIKGGENVGQHLSLLGQYFPGYSVTWIGSFVGLCYGAIVGGIAGWLICFIYNRIVDKKNK